MGGWIMLNTPAARAYAALAILCLLIAASVAGWLVGIEQESDRRVAEVATLHQSYSDAAREATQDSLARLQASQILGDQITRRLQATEADLAAHKSETDREIKRLTTGRVCLSADAVRVLNARAEAGSRASSVPGTAGLSAAADAAGAASDTDVGLWISDARTRYSQCAERVNALIDFHEGKQP